MKKQNYENHIFYYIPHHVVFYSAIIGLCVICTYGIIKDAENSLIWLVLSGIVLALGALSFMLRQHYALGNQNRTVRLELRFRYYVLTQKRLEDIEKQLNLSQLLALRFASDEELVALIDKTINEKLSPDEIKRSVKNWVGDYMRV